MSTSATQIACPLGSLTVQRGTRGGIEWRERSGCTDSGDDRRCNTEPVVPERGRTVWGRRTGFYSEGCGQMRRMGKNSRNEGVEKGVMRDTDLMAGGMTVQGKARAQACM